MPCTEAVMRLRSQHFAAVLTACFVASAATSAWGVDYHVNSSASFINAVAAIRAGPTANDRIIFDTDISLAGNAGALSTTGTVTIVGNGNFISGDGFFRPLFIDSGNVVVQNLEIRSGLANGGDGAGGGLGAGGGMFVNSGANVTLEGVLFQNNQAVGGNGGTTERAGGGGLGGNGGGPGSGGGGGGGLTGNGGNGGFTAFPNLGGGGGGGGTTNGTNGGAGTAGSGTGGGGNGGLGGANGSAGGPFGGGGGGQFGNGGQGGDFGGGGGAGVTNPGGPGGVGGNGGFGGGGGGGDGNSGFGGGNGGFGGGGGLSPTSPGTGGFGGGDGGTTGGGGGAAFGGALFVRAGGKVTIVNGVNFSGSTLTAGAAGGNGTAGDTDGQDLFLMRGTTTEFNITGANTFNFTGTLGNDDGTGNAGVAMVKSGTGTLEISGDATFVGSTSIDAGTLFLSGVLGGTTYVNNGGTLNVDTAGVIQRITVNGGTARLDGGQFGNALVNSGTFNVDTNGGVFGDLRMLGGVTTVTGQIFGNAQIDGGRLVVNGNVFGLMNVGPNGTLGGNGNVATTNMQGTMAPGNSIGNITINGHYNQLPGSTYDVELNDTGQSDHIDVLGDANISTNTRVRVTAAPGTYNLGDQYTIITTGGAVNGRYSSLDYGPSLPFARFSLLYELDKVMLVVSRGLDTSNLTFNQLAVANVLTNVGFPTDPQLAAVIAAIEGLPANQQAVALDQLSAELYGTLFSTGFQSTENWLQSIGNRLRPSGGAFQTLGRVSSDGGFNGAADSALSGDGEFQLVSLTNAMSNSQDLPLQNMQTTAPATRPMNYGWVGGYGIGGDVSGNGNAQGLGYGVGGTTFGIDRYLGAGTIAGVAGGYAGSSVNTDNNLQSARVNAYQGALYLSHLGERFYAFGILSGGANEYRTTRVLPGALTASAKFDGYEFSNYLETGLNWRAGAWNLQPSTGLQYILLHQDAFTETGAGGAGLSATGNGEDSLRPNLGLRLSRLYNVGGMSIIPDLHARYAYELLSCNRLVTANFAGLVGNSFTTAGNQLGRNFGQYGLGVNAALTRRFGCYGGYDLMTADRAVSHTGSGGLQLVW